MPISNPSKILKRVSGLSSDLKEFAREMLMFPLSVKNPYTPLMAKRSKKINKPPRKDTTYHLTGPERFLDLSRKELGQVWKAPADHSTPETALDKMLNVIPFYGHGFYRHPAYNYGDKYGAATGSPNISPDLSNVVKK